MFGEQREEWVRRLPAPVASLFNGHRTTAAVRSTAVRAAPVEQVERMKGPAIREIAPAGRRGWLVPVLLLAALALVGIPMLRGLTRPHVVVAPAPIPHVVVPVPEVASLSLPNGVAIMVARGSAAYELASFLAGPHPAPQRFTLSPMNFEFGTSRLTVESQKTISDVASILKAYPTTAIRVEGYTDNVGTPDDNLQLSLARADEVKSLLAGKGVDASRVATAGLGQDNPLAPNDTEAGRAKNRRTDILVTSR
jgi:outer membrane protein OmpA-like peptidoglycan-associated protein